jgi:membrane-associated protein
MPSQVKVDPRYIKIFVSLLLLGLIFFLFSYLDDYTINLFISYILIFRYYMLFLVVYAGGVGMPIPVNVFLMAIGAFVEVGYFNFYGSFAVSLVANVMGDSTGYFLFRKFGHKILRDKYAAQYKFFNKLEKFFMKNQNLSIFVSRIIGIFCTPVDFLSGYMKIPYSKFLTFDILGNSVFVALFLSIGYFVGEKWIKASDLVSDFMGIISLVLIFYIIKTLFAKNEEGDINPLS